MIPILCPLLIAAALSMNPPSERPIGYWKGEIDLGGPLLDIVIDIEENGEELRGTLDIPKQNVFGAPLTVTIEDEELILVVRDAPGNPSFRGEYTADLVEGNYHQGTRSFRFYVARAAKPARQAIPVPPYPYDEVPAEFRNGDTKLVGTLTLPRDGTGHPAVVLLSGSGPQDRDSTIYAHRPFLLIADHLTRAGIAVLRYDDRGVGESSGNLMETTSTDLSNDALAAIGWLQTRPEIDPKRIGLLGLSEGGMIAPYSASRSAEVAFVLMLAGPTIAGDVIIATQRRAIDPNATKHAPIHELADQMVEILKSPRATDEVRAEVTDLIAQQLALESGRPKSEIDVTSRNVSAMIESVLTPWYRDFLRVDPSRFLSKVTVPLLALNGSLDQQVDADINLAALRKSLVEGEHSDFTLKRLEGLNHLFQPTETGAPSEYATSPITIDPGVLDLIRDWILVRFPAADSD